MKDTKLSEEGEKSPCCILTPDLNYDCIPRRREREI